MALRNASLFLYGFQVTENNRSIDFQAASGGPVLKASLTLGYYSLSALCTEIKRQMQVADPAHTYTVSVDRSVAGGRENRVSVATSGAFLALLFGSGERAASSVAPLIGFQGTDRTGATSYQGTGSAGTRLIPSRVGHNYLPPEAMRKTFGTVNVSASGLKEAIVYATQKFWQVQFKYVPEAEALSDWSQLLTWAIAQRPVEFTPDVSDPERFFVGTLEQAGGDSNGLSFQINEMLPAFPFKYDTGLMKFRVKE